ncbi:hypothetical protein MVEG_01808 [Podila verticillata NRRL 6337]|nr:hypothetical protein MVEG_03295 [Podila verticillata NRRL 6337]KFH71509.1 hypothetical protein MVEG_01808 [Podila verticillata NRRL 6337]
MPPLQQRFTTRQLLLKEYEELFIQACGDHAQLQLSRPGLYPYLPLAYYDILVYLHTTRYLKPRQRMPFSTVLREEVLPKYTPEQLERILRVTPLQLGLLVDLIRESEQFKSKDPARPQAPVRTQLTVALYRLGTKGLSTHKHAFTMGIGQGTVDLYTWRCIFAIEELQSKFIVWPDQARKAVISSWFKNNKGFPSAIGAVDGVPIPFESAPHYDTASWNTRKFVHAMGCTAVCDHQGRFTYVSTGYVGSMHDSLAYRDTYLHGRKDEFFQGKEYILGDAAYAISTTVIPRYKGANHSRDELTFNLLHGSARVKIEHAFGWLKLKWQSLQNLPVKVNKRKHVTRASSWVMACFILHNFCLMNPDGIESDDAEDNWNERALHAPPPQYEDIPIVGVDNANDDRERQAAKAKRDKLKEWVLRNRRRIRR